MDFMGHNVFSEIPIYRCSYEEYEKTIETRRSRLPQITDTSIYDCLYNNGVLYNYEYNEVIGYICLYVFGNQLHAGIYMENARVKRSGIRKKNFRCIYGDAFVILLEKDMTSMDIFSSINEELKRLNKLEFKGRYIDLLAFETMGKYTDWRKLVDDLNFKTHISNKPLSEIGEYLHSLSDEELIKIKES